MITQRTLDSAVPAPFTPAYVRSPGATHAWLQRNDPLHQDPATRMMLVSRHADCAELLRHPATSAAGGQADRQERAGVPRSMLTTDGAEHDALRRPGMILLGPAAAAELAGRALAGLDARLDLLAAAGAPVDLTPQLAEPVATDMVAALLDVPDAGRDPVDAHARAVSIALNPVPDPDTAFRSRVLMAQFGRYLAEQVERARQRPADTPLTRFVADGRLSDEQVTGVLSLAVVGGWSPLAEVLTSTLLVLLTDPAAAASAASGPEGATDLVEEVLRWHSPIPFVARRATGRIELPGGVVPAGAMMLLLLGAANRDPQVYPEPDRVLPDRRPRGHLAFGAGGHFCLGAALVRAVAGPVVHRFATRFPAAAPEPTRTPAPVLAWRPEVFPRRVVSRSVRLEP